MADEGHAGGGNPMEVIVFLLGLLLVMALLVWARKAYPVQGIPPPSTSASTDNGGGVYINPPPPLGNGEPYGPRIHTPTYSPQQDQQYESVNYATQQ